MITLPLLYSVASVLIVSLISLVGIFALSWKKEFLGKFLFILVSVAIGALLGDALLHLLPEALDELGPTTAPLFVIAGILSFFILEKFLHWHHAHGEERMEAAEHRKIHPLGTLVLVSDGVHNFIDGVIIGASYLVSIEVGLITTAAIILHEIPQEIGDFAILIHAGFTRVKALLFNFVSGFTAVAGALLVYLFSSVESIVPMAAAFSAGAFLYIAGSDLVPELHKTTRVSHTVVQVIAILFGVGTMVALLFLE